MAGFLQPSNPIRHLIRTSPFVLSRCALSSPARWPLQTGASNKSPGRLDALQQHRHALLIDYRRSNMMHRVTSVSLLLAVRGGSLFSTPCHRNPSLVLQPPRSSSAHSVPNSEDGIKFLEKSRRFCVWVLEGGGLSKERRCALRPRLHEWMVDLWLQHRVDEAVT